jgi:hypothetical protein
MNSSTRAAPSEACETMPAGQRGKTVVLYIGGSGRSGSTLLDRILGRLPRVCAVGEVVHIWTRGVIGNQLCGCGAVFRECPFWQEVGERAFGGWASVDPREVVSLDRTVNRHRYIPLMLAAPPSSSYARRARAYVELQERLYRAISHASDSKIVVDSSKEAAYAFLLERMRDVNLRLIHLVRDSRGVAYSWRKQVIRPEVTSRRVYMPTYHPARAAGEWMVDNLLFHLLGARGVPRLLVLYERIATQPRQEIERILGFLGQPIDNGLDFLGKRHVLLSSSHNVSGNPMRFIEGIVPLTLDDEWRRKMTPRERLLVSAMTWPLLTHYEYGKPAR